MSVAARHIRFETEQLAQGGAATLLILAALAAAAGTLGAIFELWPWIGLELSFGGAAVPWAGMAVQIGVTLVLCLIAMVLPTALRVLALERTHRDFAVSMSDVAEAYAICHAADRHGVFTLAREYDAVRERIEHLRQHPSLELLEADVITAAAQMSTVSRALAETYSVAALDHARGMLKQREDEIARFRSQIEAVTPKVNALRRALEDVQLDEAVCESRLKQLEDHLGEAAKDLGLLRQPDTRHAAE